jgi:hypothetical protein
VKKSVVVAVALVGTLTLSGAANLLGSATADSKAHTLKLVLHNIASHDTGNERSVGADTVKSGGKIVGYASNTARYYPALDKAVGHIAFALNGGTIIGRVSLKGSGSRFAGPIVAGSGRYKRVEGTITGRATGSLRTFVTLRYRF